MKMTIDIERVNPNLQIMVIKLGTPLTTIREITEWNSRIDLIADELEEVPCAKRVSYDKWEWTSNHELNRYITYYFMRFENNEVQ